MERYSAEPSEMSRMCILEGVVGMHEVVVVLVLTVSLRDLSITKNPAGPSETCRKDDKARARHDPTTPDATQETEHQAHHVTTRLHQMQHKRQNTRLITSRPDYTRCNTRDRTPGASRHDPTTPDATQETEHQAHHVTTRLHQMQHQSQNTYLITCGK